MSLHKIAGLAGALALVGALSATVQAQDSTKMMDSTKTMDSTKMMDSTHHHMRMKGGYMATLSSPSGGTASGKGWVHGGTKASVMIMGDSVGAVRPWHVHKGSCGNDLGVFGNASAYQPITIGSDGKGKGTATLSMALPDTGSYFINIHASSSNMKTIVACGALTMNK